MPIDPIPDSYVDSIIKANAAADPSSVKTQGTALRQLVKLLRDRSEQQLAAGATGLTAETTARTAADTALQAQLDALEPLTAANIETALGFTPADDTAVVHTALTGAANGIAPLDGNTKVPAAYLPSYVDDVLEYASFAALPATGETGKIYVTLDTNKEYRWSGSTYIQLVASPGSTDAVPEGSLNLYFTAARVLATLLAGISFATASAVVSTDSLLIALGKLQAQLNQGFLLLTGGNLSGQLNINNSALAVFGSNPVTSPSIYLTNAGLKVGSSGNLTHGYMGFQNGAITLDDGTSLFIINMPAKNGTFALTSDVASSAKINYNFYQTVI